MPTSTVTGKRQTHTTTVAAHEQAEQIDNLIDDDDANRLPFVVRLRPDTLALVDRAARRLNLSRSAFVASTVAERVANTN